MERKLTDLLNLRALVRERHPHSQRVSECTVIEVAPSRKWVKVRWAMSGSDVWVDPDEYTVVEELGPAPFYPRVLEQPYVPEMPATGNQDDLSVRASS